MSDSTVESTHMSKTPITTKSSVGAKKKRRYNEVIQARGVVCMTSAKREKERKQ